MLHDTFALSLSRRHNQGLHGITHRKYLSFIPHCSKCIFQIKKLYHLIRSFDSFQINTITFLTGKKLDFFATSAE